MLVHKTTNERAEPRVTTVVVHLQRKFRGGAPLSEEARVIKNEGRANIVRLLVIELGILDVYSEQ